MGQDLTFARPPPDDRYRDEDVFELPLRFYHAVSTTTHPVFRFVGASTSAVATDKPKQFSKVSGAGAAAIGILQPHIHDSKNKEYWQDVAVGEQSGIASLWTKCPVTVEAGAGITAGELVPLTEISTDADGKAIPAASGHRVLAHAKEAISVEGVTYVRLVPTASGRVV